MTDDILYRQCYSIFVSFFWKKKLLIFYFFFHRLFGDFGHIVRWPQKNRKLSFFKCDTKKKYFDKTYTFYLVLTKQKYRIVPAELWRQGWEFTRIILNYTFIFQIVLIFCGYILIHNVFWYKRCIYYIRTIRNTECFRAVYYIFRVFAVVSVREASVGLKRQGEGVEKHS